MKVGAFFRRKRAWLLAGPLSIGLALLVLDHLFPLPLRPDYSPVVLAADGRTVLHTTLNRAQQWRMYARLAEISPLLRRAIVEKEDRWFWRHPGVNPAAVARAFWVNLTGSRARPLGASTITMQVARLLEPKMAGCGRVGISYADCGMVGVTMSTGGGKPVRVKPRELAK